jgi:hypothetical protein
MNSSVPIWIQVLQALLTPIIAALAVAIAYGQWRTGRQQVVLELFERRMAIYDGIREVIGKIIRSGSVTDDDQNAYNRAIDRVDILFGSEVTAYLSVLRTALTAHHLAELLVERSPSQKARENSVNRQTKAFETIQGFYTEFPKLMSRYVQMHQRVPDKLSNKYHAFSWIPKWLRLK